MVGKRGQNHVQGDGKHERKVIAQLPTFVPDGPCKHRTKAVVGGRDVCGEGCGKDFGPARIEKPVYTSNDIPDGLK